MYFQIHRTYFNENWFNYSACKPFIPVHVFRCRYRRRPIVLVVLVVSHPFNERENKEGCLPDSNGRYTNREPI